jgi:D-arabinose 1-dehydrogenase-like Zn-dependent alcohol dehydrogenase
MVRNTYEVLGDRAPVPCSKEDADSVAIGFDVPNGEPKEIPFKFPELLPTEMRMKITKTGFCASDAFQYNGGWKSDDQMVFPLVPGHEVAGHVT